MAAASSCIGPSATQRITDCGNVKLPHIPFRIPVAEPYGRSALIFIEMNIGKTIKQIPFHFAVAALWSAHTRRDQRKQQM